MSNLRRQIPLATARGYGWLNCFGCGTLGPYRIVNGQPYCRTCEAEGVPLSIVPVQSIGERVRPTYPTVPVTYDELPPFVRARLEDPWRTALTTPRPNYTIPYPDWSEIQDPRD